MSPSLIECMGLSGPTCPFTCACWSEPPWAYLSRPWEKKSPALMSELLRRELSPEREGNLLIIHWVRTRAELKPYRLQVSTWNPPCVSHWSRPVKYFSLLTHTPTSGLRSPRYPPVAAAVAGGLRPESWICLVSQNVSWELFLQCGQLSACLRPCSGDWPFLGPQVESPSVNHRLIFQINKYVFLLRAE